MSDTTPPEGNRNPETDAAEATGEFREPADYTEPDSSAADEHGDAADTEPAGYSGTGSHAALTPEPLPTPVAAETVKRDTYVPAATVGGTGAATVADDYAEREQYPEYAPAQPIAQTPIYVQAPTPPRNRGNRGAGILIALLATVVYAALYALAAFVIVGVNSSAVTDATERFSEFVVRPVFYVPVIFFFLTLALMIALVNRGGWWAYVLFGFLVAVVVYFSYIGGALLTVQAWNLTPADAATFVGRQLLNPGAIAAAVIAREVTIWAGAWIARRGRSVTARNVEARQAYERQLAEGPQLSRSA